MTVTNVQGKKRTNVKSIFISCLLLLFLLLCYYTQFLKSSPFPKYPRFCLKFDFLNATSAVVLLQHLNFPLWGPIKDYLILSIILSYLILSFFLQCRLQTSDLVKLQPKKHQHKRMLTSQRKEGIVVYHEYKGNCSFCPDSSKMKIKTNEEIQIHQQNCVVQNEHKQFMSCH